MDFPYDFVFITSTKADDGDPLDALLPMEEPAYPGTLIRLRAVGIIAGEQKEDGKSQCKDRVLMVSECSLEYSGILKTSTRNS
jgi:inorganic pyrophosphatase